MADEDLVERLVSTPGEELERLARALDRGAGVDAGLGLAAAGFSGAQAALLLRAVARAQRRSERVELVASGPTGAGAARLTATVVDELFRSARRSVLVVGFAVHDGRQVFAGLAERMDAESALEVTCCFDISRPIGDTSRDDEVVGRFAHQFVTQEWPGRRLPRVYCDRRALLPHTPGSGRAALHAKAIAVDDERVLVTSANLTAAAQARNVELGLLVRIPAIAIEVREHFERLIADGVLTAVALPRARA